jgi:hypothetical protein
MRPSWNPTRRDKYAFTKEDFARRYAKSLFEHLARQGVLPFGPLLDEHRLSADGLNREWFHPPCL